MVRVGHSGVQEERKTWVLSFSFQSRGERRTKIVFFIFVFGPFDKRRGAEREEGDPDGSSAETSRNGNQSRDRLLQILIAQFIFCSPPL